MKQKRVAAMLMTLVMSVSLLAGCGSNSTGSSASNTSGATQSEAESGSESKQEESKESSSSGEKVVIRVTKWGDAGVEQQLAEEFNATHDDIEIQLDAIPGDGYGDRLTTSFSSGDGYDIFLSGEGDFYKWVGLGMVESLDPYIAQDTDWENPMSDSIMNMGVVGTTQSYLIKDYNPMCLWYNKDMFDEASVGYPTEDWTWDDLYEAAGKLTSRNASGDYETFGFQAQKWGYAVASYLESLGYSYLSEDYATADGYLNNPNLAQALDTYFGWAEGDDRISPNAADEDTYGGGTSMMINGKLAMMITGGWAKSSLEDAGTNYATALLPDSHKSYFCASGYAISTTCKDKDAAWEVLKWLTSERASELRADQEAVLPTSEAQLQTVIESYSEDQQAMLISLEYSVAPVGMRGEIGSKVNTLLGDALERIAYRDGDTQEILDEVVTEIHGE